MLKNENNDIVAFFNVLFVCKLTFSRFIEGEIREKEILADQILSPQDPQNEGEDYVYISLVLIKSSHRIRTLVNILLYLAKYLDLLRSNRTINKIYALLVSENFRDLSKKLDLTVNTPDFRRKDKHDLFVLDTSQIEFFFEYLLERKPRFTNEAKSIESKSEDKWKPIFLN